MRITFNIEYRTQLGEEVRISGNLPELGNNNQDEAVPMTSHDATNWQLAMDVKVASTKTIKYHYLIVRNGCVQRCEWNCFERTLRAHNLNNKEYVLNDCWKDLPTDSYLYASAFTESWTAHIRNSAGSRNAAQSVLIRAMVPCGTGQRVAVCGSCATLGEWNPGEAPLMSQTYYPEWQLELSLDKLDFPLEYKFVLVDEKSHQVIAWENGDNRRMERMNLGEKTTVALPEVQPCFDVPAWKGAGVVIPIFSLRSEGSFGVGDFGDLKRMTDWAAMTGQKVVQTLPIYDTTITRTWTDSYPYNSISIYALHPMYIDLRQLSPLDNAAQAARFEQLRMQLNALPQVDYEAVNNAKWEYLRLLFAQEGCEVLQSAGFKQFFDANREWLMPYAAFSHLRDIYGTANFRDWPCHSTYEPNEIAALCSPESKAYDSIAIYYYVQYFLDKQLLAVSSYARPKGVVLKGDIPIGISRNSVEAWMEPHYFNLNGQAGAPPDHFSANGQNWGFPTYNWEVMERDGYAWWMKRFKKMSEYFDAYRIDHILGFFRIWEIPMHSVHGLLGQFAPALPMSVEEIEAYGLRFDKERFTRPYICEEQISELFGARAQWVKDTFMQPSRQHGLYDMRPEYDTQRKVQAVLAGESGKEAESLREGLYALISNVLFVPHRDNPDLYHPRISAQLDTLYNTLDKAQRLAFNNLYNDYFYKRQNDFWRQQAMKKLPSLTQSTNMLVCGEDLGMIPDCVPQVMDELRILALEIQRMPKVMYQDFGNPAQFPYRSVCTISTHDMSTLRGWWKEDANNTKMFYNRMLRHDGLAPADATPEVCEEIVKQHLYGNSMLCILSLQDWLSVDGALRFDKVDEERINVPAIPQFYWRYRMHLTLEQLLSETVFNEKVKSMITHSERL